MRRLLALLVSALTGALIAALVVVAFPAEGAPNGGGPGDPLLLSRVNQAGPMTVLKSNGGLRILAKNPKRPPLMIYTSDNMPPLQVSSKAKVANLNADLLDGLDSTAFVRDTQLLAAYAGGDHAVAVTYADTVVRSVSLTPPSAGTVIANSTTAVSEPTAGHGVLCSITTGTALDQTHRQEWESGGVPGYTGQLAGTRGFAVTGGTPFTANLVCRHYGGGMSETSSLLDSAMTAIFTPSP